jgi:hypothetical protein
MLFECDAEDIEKGMAWFVGPGAARPLKNLIAIDWFALSSRNRVSGGCLSFGARDIFDTNEVAFGRLFRRRAG